MAVPGQYLLALDSVAQFPAVLFLRSSVAVWFPLNRGGFLYAASRPTGAAVSS